MNPSKTKSFCLKDIDGFQQKSQEETENLPLYPDVVCFGEYLGRPI